MRRRNIPRIDQNGKKEYLELHLYNELRWLLGAATEWSLQDQLGLDIVGYNVQVYAMDSACLHARALFEFFAVGATPNHLSCADYIGHRLVSEKYEKWKGTLHAFLMHAQLRSNPRPLETANGVKDLNQMPVEFGNEVLRLWTEFEKALETSQNSGDKELGKLARERRRESIDRAKCVVESEIAKYHSAVKKISLKPVFLFS